jgi:two-component system CheB/CheR fusion protein
MTQDKIKLNESPLDLRTTVDDAVASVRSLADDCEIDIEVTVPEAAIPVVGDTVRLQQIQANLLSNAIKYSPPGERVQLEIGRDGEFAVIRVADNGAGISPQSLDRIFDMFVQTDNTLDRAQGGMGVGLTLVRKLVDLHGGTVVARSKGLGCGSEFEVRLPLRSVDEPVSSGGQDARPPHAPQAVERIVLVEDQDDNRKMLASLLEMYGFHVDAAASGAEGVAVITSERPDAAIIDIGLPEIDGYEVARRVREALGEDITLVALTGYGQSQDVEKARAAGFDHHLVKPLQVDRLAAVLGHPAKAVGKEG